MTIAKQWTWERNHLFPFLMKKCKPIEIAFIFSICIYDLPQKNRLSTSDIYYLWNGNYFEGVLSLKFTQVFTGNSLPKKLDSRIFTKWIGLSDISFHLKCFPIYQWRETLWNWIVACWYYCNRRSFYHINKKIQANNLLSHLDQTHG